MSDPLSGRSNASGRKSGSIPENKSGFTVPASPLNPVKLELGLVLVFGFFLFFIISYMVESQTAQFASLGAYGFFSMLWLIHRARKLVSQLS